MIRRIIFDALLILSIIGLLYTRYVDISIYGYRPDLLLIFVTFIGLFEGKYHAILFGFTGGLCIDFISGNSLLGFNAMIYTIIGYLSIVPHKLFHVDSVIVSPIVSSVFFLLKTFFYMVIGYIFLDFASLSSYLNNVFIGQFIYTALISIPIFIIMKKIYSFMEKLKKYV